jgi:hypothetical protein
MVFQIHSRDGKSSFGFASKFTVWINRVFISKKILAHGLIVPLGKAFFKWSKIKIEEITQAHSFVLCSLILSMTIRFTHGDN